MDTTLQKEQWTTPLREGDTVPHVHFHARVAIFGDSKEIDRYEWSSISSQDLFQNKRVVLFALPGAFTPTCSSFHLPGYIQQFSEILSCGIDEVYCLSVNDAFVMREWGLDVGLEPDTTSPLYFKTVRFISDGAALFTRGMGLSCIWDELGERSWRYSAVITNGVIEKIFIEQPFVQNSIPDPFHVSDALSMLNYLQSKKDNSKS